MVSQASVTGAGFVLSGLTLPMTFICRSKRGFHRNLCSAICGRSERKCRISEQCFRYAIELAAFRDGTCAGIAFGQPDEFEFRRRRGWLNDQALSETLMNTSSASVTITQANLTGTGFSINGLSLPLTLAAGQRHRLQCSVRALGRGIGGRHACYCEQRGQPHTHHSTCRNRLGARHAQSESVKPGVWQRAGRPASDAP